MFHLARPTSHDCEYEYEAKASQKKITVKAIMEKTDSLDFILWTQVIFIQKGSCKPVTGHLVSAFDLEQMVVFA